MEVSWNAAAPFPGTFRDFYRLRLRLHTATRHSRDCNHQEVSRILRREADNDAENIRSFGVNIFKAVDNKVKYSTSSINRTASTPFGNLSFTQRLFHKNAPTTQNELSSYLYRRKKWQLPNHKIPLSKDSVVSLGSSSLSQLHDSHLTCTSSSSCDVSDGLVKLGKLQGGFLPGLTMWSPKRQEGSTKIVGPAYTVKYVAADYEAAKHPSHYVRSQRYVSSEYRTDIG
ncbi:hypothetical protein LIA77_03459 [Sarocladium implicatum]|nr:hypothetical protein LIA77_03459 [Sarocladium implicatum]